MAPYGSSPKPMGIELTSVGNSKQHAKTPYGHPSKKGKHVATPRKVTFQKKLVEEGQSNLVLLRGLLPEIDVDATELEVRSIIANVIANFSKETSSCSRYSFEFIEATGKNLCVPAKSSKFEWLGKAVKNLAGCGQVCV